MFFFCEICKILRLLAPRFATIMSKNCVMPFKISFVANLVGAV